MKSPLRIRPLTHDEKHGLHQGLHSSSTFVFKRCQILLASTHGKSVEEISVSLGCSRQGVRNILHAFAQEGLVVTLSRRSNRHQTGPAAHPVLAEQERGKLRRILEQSPRCFSKEASLWTIPLLAQVIHEEKLSTRRLSNETVRIH